MNVPVMDRQPEISTQSLLGYVDCDIHPYFKSPADLDPFLSARWQEHRRTIGARSRQALANTAQYPRLSPGTGMRMDAWPADGGHPGSDHLSGSGRPAALRTDRCQRGGAGSLRGAGA